MKKQIRLADLLGRQVVDPSGKRVGHLEEVEAEWRDGRLTVTRYLLGVRGLLTRLSIEAWRSHEAGVGPGYTATSDQMDVSDPERPRLTCPASKLHRLESAPAQRGDR